MSDALALDNVRSSLIRQEDSIIFALIERAQFARNAAVYDASALSLPGAAVAACCCCGLRLLLHSTAQRSTALAAPLRSQHQQQAGKQQTCC